VHLSGAVRRIHWLLFERAKSEADKKERETYVQRLEHRLLQKAAQVNALQQKLAAVEKVDKPAANVKPAPTSRTIANKVHYGCFLHNLSVKRSSIFCLFRNLSPP
jgi:hypothetical protein